MDLKKNKELLFWGLQFLGWGMVNSVIFVLPLFSMTYKLASYLAALVIGIGITSIYRIFINKVVDVESITFKSIYRLFLLIILTSVVYYFASYCFDEAYDFLIGKTEKESNFHKSNFSYIDVSITCFVTILGWTTIYLTAKFVMNSNKNRLETLELNSILKEAQLNTLKGQINPHFMFNSLNNIRGLMLEDVDKSREMITKLSEMLQYALSKNSVDAIALSEEVEMVDNYIALAKIQMEDRLSYVKDIEPKSSHIAIPPMIIQLLVENAAKHGIAKLKQGGVITLQTKIEDGTLAITVCNTGTLSIDKNSTKLGLKNIQQRLRLLYGQQASFSLDEINNEVVAVIKIPLS